MADEFAVESRTIDTIRVSHLRYDHRYIFTVMRKGDRRILWSGPRFGNAKASVPAVTLTGAARTFAEREREARAAGLID